MAITLDGAVTVAPTCTISLKKRAGHRSVPLPLQVTPVAPLLQDVHGAQVLAAAAPEKGTARERAEALPRAV